MKFIIITFILTQILLSDPLNDKIVEHCKNEANEYQTKELYDHVYNTCYEEYIKEYLTMEELEKKLMSNKIKEEEKEVRNKIQKQNQLAKQNQRKKNTPTVSVFGRLIYISAAAATAGLSVTKPPPRGSALRGGKRSRRNAGHSASCLAVVLKELCQKPQSPSQW